MRGQIIPLKHLSWLLLNVRSSAGKTFLINDFITEHTLDFMFLTETWLDQTNSAAVLIESTPPGYSFISEARVSRRGGGVAVLFNESFQCKQLSPGSFQSFSYMAIKLKAIQTRTPGMLSDSSISALV